MPDELTHVLVAYTLGTLLSTQYEWLTPQYVTVVMLGAVVPDVMKIKHLVGSHQVELLVGVPFDWEALHTLGGVLVAIAIGALCTTSEYRRRVFLLLFAGALSHLTLDALVVVASGHSSPLLFPFTTYQLPTPGLYHSADRWPAVVSGTLAALVYLRYRWYPER